MFAQLRKFPSGLWRLEARFKGAKFLGKAEFLGRPVISVAKGSRMVLGDGVRVWSSMRSNPLGCPQPCILRAMAAGAELILGSNVGLSGAVLCAAASIKIGEGTVLGAGAMIIDNDFHFPVGEWGWGGETANARPITIGRGVFIGTRAIVLKGVTIGDRAIVGAGTVVTQDVAPGHVAAGNPARVFLPPSKGKVETP
jgi:acetyltransferase-like isoleucine patch superfamily enzyme